MPERDLTALIKGLSPSALAIFKRQLSSLPQAERQRAFSRLSGISELADIIGRPTPMRDIAQVQPRQPVQPRMADVPLWQRGLQKVTAPFDWISRNITEPFGAIVSSPFTPATAGTEGMGWLQRERAEYKAWDDPNWGFLGVKGALETLPWLAVPSAGGVAGRLGMLAAKGGAVGRAAGIAAKAVKPVAAVEALPGRAIGGVVKGVLPKKAIPKAKATPVTPEVTSVPPKVTSKVFPGGVPEEHETAIKWLTGLVRKSKPLTKETLELRKPEHAFRSAEYDRLLQEKVASGMPVKQASMEATDEALRGAYSQAPLTPAFLEALKEQGKYEATLLRMIADAPIQYGFERKNAFGAFWDLLQEGRLQMNQIQTLEKVFGSDLAKALLEKHRTLGQKIWFNVVDVANIPRGLLSMADLSGFGRQGWILTTTRPDKALQAVRPMIQAMFRSEDAAFMDGVFLNRKHIDKVLKLRPDFLTKWAGEATDIVAREEGFASRWLNKMPIVGQVYKGSTRAYTTVLNDLRTANVSAAISGWEKKGFKYLTPEEAGKMFGGDTKALFNAKFYTDTDIDLLARTVSWAGGRGSLPTDLARHAGVANAIFFAPKLIASRVEFPLAVLPFVTPSKLARSEAMRELISFLGAGVGILGMAQLSGAGTIELDPRSSDFGKLKSGDTRLDIWTGYSQYLRFIAQMATAQGKTAGGRIAAKERGDLVWRFAQSKFSPAAGFIKDWIAGETYIGEEMPPRSAKGIVGQLYQRSMPLAIQDLVDGYLEDSWSGGIVSSFGILGVGVVTYTDEAKRERDKVARKQDFNKDGVPDGLDWEEIGKQYGRATQLRLEQTTPSILEIEKEEERRLAVGTPTKMERWQKEGQSYEDAYREAIKFAVNKVKGTKDWVQFRKDVEDASKFRRTAYGTRAKRAEYQDIVAYYSQPLKAEQIAKMNPGDVLRREYYQKMYALDMYDPNTNEYDFDEADKREREFVMKYGQQALDYIESYQGARWLDKPVELKMLEEAKETLKPYWEITDRIWSLYPPELKKVSDQIEIMAREDPTAERRLLRQYPSILRARELIARYRKQMRQYTPAIRQAYRMFYG